MEIRELTTREEIDNLGDALAWVDVPECSGYLFLEWVKQYTPVKNEILYLIKGYNMNCEYDFTGEDQFPDEMNFFVIRLEDIENPSALYRQRKDIHVMFLSDIVDNNPEWDIPRINDEVYA